MQGAASGGRAVLGRTIGAVRLRRDQLMACSAKVVTVGTAATRLDSTRITASAQGVAVYNMGAAIVWLGGADVSVGQGTPMYVDGEPFSADLAQYDELYGIVASGTVEVRVFEVGV